MDVKYLVDFASTDGDEIWKDCSCNLLLTLSLHAIIQFS